MPDISENSTLGSGKYDFSKEKHNFVPQLRDIAEKDSSLQKELKNIFEQSQGDREKAAKEIMKDWQTNPVNAVVAGNGVRFRELVGGKLVESKATKEGDKVKLLGRYIMGPNNQGFLKVALGDGSVGYIAAAYLRKKEIPSLETQQSPATPETAPAQILSEKPTVEPKPTEAKPPVAPESLDDGIETIGMEILVGIRKISGLESVKNLTDIGVTNTKNYGWKLPEGLQWVDSVKSFEVALKTGYRGEAGKIVPIEASVTPAAPIPELTDPAAPKLIEIKPTTPSEIPKPAPRPPLNGGDGQNDTDSI